MPHQKDVYHALHGSSVVYSDYKESDLHGPLLDFTQFLLTVYKVSICDDATLISSNCQKKVTTKHLPGLSI